MPPRNFLIIVVTVAISVSCYTVATRNRYANLFAEALDVVDAQSLAEIPREQLFGSAIEGMIRDHDPYTRYLAGDMQRQFDEDIHQQFGGVGMYVDRSLNDATPGLTVIAVMPNCPASNAGLVSGDQIVSIDDESTDGTTRTDAIKRLRGPVAKPVIVTLDRNGTMVKKTIVRDVIPVDSVRGRSRDGNGNWNFTLPDHPTIGYLYVEQFGDRTTDEIRSAIESLDGQIDSLIIDLRDNSGGLLTAAIDICDLFLPPSKMIVSTRGRNKRKIDDHLSSTQPQLPMEIPIVVLLNRQSASASEIVAACLQDHERAIIVGEQSWGKGLVQTIIPLLPGQSSLKLTTATYWRPSGAPIDRHDPVAVETSIWGVQPDPGMGIEMSEEELIANIRWRQIGEIETLIPPALRPEMRLLLAGSSAITNVPVADEDDAVPGDAVPPEDGETEDGETEDGETEEVATEEDAADRDLDLESHVDRPLQRAIEVLSDLP